jgi:serine/threonine protein kinase
MGIVYEAEHTLLKRPTAIKLIQRPDQKALESFENEVKAMSKLTHPNTVAVFDYGRSYDGRLYYAMELLDGLDLEQLVAISRAQPIDRVVAILVQVAGALEEAHAKQFIHRDIKPRNIILTARNGTDVAKVADYGIVAEIDSPATGELTGTPLYIAPEAIAGKAVTASDLYALGAVAYFLISGKPIFDDTALARKLDDDPAPLGQVAPHAPRELVELVTRLLARRPADRPTATELLAELARIPAQGDWDAARSTAWWKDFLAKRRATPSPNDRTVTLQIALKSDAHRRA